jgi:hypothetical protein
MTSITVTDGRAPAPEAPPTLADRFPLGAIVAWNGAVEDGQRRRAVVVEHHDDEGSITVLDGVERVVVTAEELTSAIVLAASADRYAQRVSNKARALGRTHSWCEVAEQAITELNQTPEDADERGAMNVVVTTVGHYRLVPTRDGRTRLTGRHNGDLTALLRERFYASNGEFDRGYLRSQPETVAVHSVQIELVDALPTAAAPAAG